MRKLGVCVAVFAAVMLIALPATASAKSYTLKGTVAGVTTAKVTVKVKVKKGGQIARINALEFKQVPVTCADGSSGAISASFPAFPVRGKDFTRRTKITGVGIDEGFVRVAGAFRRGGKTAKGQVRFAFQSGGAGCGTDDVAWKAVK